MSTVGNFHRRYQTEGLLGLADHRPVRKKTEFGTVADAVVEAMRQAIKDGIDDSTRTGTYLIWRTGEILRENGETAELPSQSTLYRLLAPRAHPEVMNRGRGPRPAGVPAVLSCRGAPRAPAHLSRQGSPTPARQDLRITQLPERLHHPG